MSIKTYSIYYLKKAMLMSETVYDGEKMHEALLKWAIPETHAPT